MESESHSARSGPSAVERRLATILMADVFGYSKMMGEDEERTVAILRGHREVFEQLLKAHRGRIFNTAGDSILAEFPSAVEAVRCATEIQTALRTRNEHLPENQRMWFRIGINLGDVIVQGGDLLGDGVNVAARIQSIAEPGGVCISGSVYDQIQNKLTLQIRPLGEKSFKNIVQPIRTFSITDDDAPRPVGTRWRTMRKGPIAATVAVVLILLGVGAAGYWLYRDYGVRTAEEARRTEESKRAAELQLKAEQEKAAAGSAQKEAALLAELQSAKDALTQAEASKRKAEADRAAAEIAQREAKLQSELKAAKDALQKAADSEKKAEEERRAASTAVKSAEAATKQAAEAPQVAAAAVAPPKVGAAGDNASDRFDGNYVGQMCFPRQQRCFDHSVTIRHGTLSAVWPSKYSSEPARADGTISPDGAVDVKLAGWNPKNGAPLPGRMTGSWSKNTIMASGAWNNGAPVTATWSRNP